MNRTSLYFKVVVEHEQDENPQRIGDEICRLIARFYGVRKAEVSSVQTTEE